MRPLAWFLVALALDACAREPSVAPTARPRPASALVTASPASIRVTPDEAFRSPPPDDAAVGALLKWRYEPPPITVSKLANGVPVEVLSQAGPALVQITLALRDPHYNAGSALDGAARAGVAARAQVPRALLFGGARDRSALELALLAEFATFAVSAGPAWVAVSVKSPASHFDQAARLLAEIATEATFPEVQLEPLKREAGMLKRIDEPDATVAWRVLPMALCGWAYPVDVELGLRADDIRAATRKDFVREYEDLFDPSQATVIVSGPVEPDHAIAALDEAFGAWKRRGNPAQPRTVAHASPRRSPRLVVIDHPGAKESSVAAAGLGPPLGSPDWPAILVLSEVLGGKSGRIARALRERRLLSWWPSMDDALPNEVANGRRRRTATEPMWLRTLGSSTSTLAFFATRGVPPEDLRTLPKRLLAVGAADVARLAKQTLDPQGTRVVVVGDWSAIRPEILKLGWGPVELRDPRGTVLGVVSP